MIFELLFVVFLVLGRILSVFLDLTIGAGGFFVGVDYWSWVSEAVTTWSSAVIRFAAHFMSRQAALALVSLGGYAVVVFIVKAIMPFVRFVRSLFP